MKNWVLLGWTTDCRLKLLWENPNKWTISEVLKFSRGKKGNFRGKNGIFGDMERKFANFGWKTGALKKFLKKKIAEIRLKIVIEEDKRVRGCGRWSMCLWLRKGWNLRCKKI